MTKIYIDFSKTTPVFGNTFAGHIGEHNAITLVITPPKSMSDNDNIINYAVAFETKDGSRYLSDTYAKSTSIETPLYSQLTTSDILYIQLEGYAEDKNIIVKSDVVFLRIGSSLGGGSAVDGSVKPQENIIQFGWSPENKEVLEGFGKISEDSIQYITYNETKLQELEQFKAKGYFKTEDFLFTTDEGSLPSSGDSKFRVYCYDLPNELIVKDIIVRYATDTGSRTEYKLSSANTRFSSCDFTNFADSSQICYTKMLDTDSWFANKSPLRHLATLLDWISEGNPITVIIEYEIPYFN